MCLFEGIAGEKEGVRVDFAGRSVKGEGRGSSVGGTEEKSRNLDYRLRVNHISLNSAGLSW